MGKRGACILLVSLVFFAAGCQGCDDHNPCGYNDAEFAAYGDDCSAPAADSTPVVTPYSGNVERIEVRPGAMQAALGSSFLLEAQLVDSDDRIVREGDPGPAGEPAILWQLPQGLTYSNNSPGGHAIVVAVASDATAYSQALPSDFNITARLEDPSTYAVPAYSQGSAVIKIVPVPVTDADAIADPATNVAPPIVAVVDGHADGSPNASCANDIVLAFVGIARLEESLIDDCKGSEAHITGAADRFATDRAFRRFDHVWQQGPETLTLVASAALDLNAKGKARVWHGVDSVATNTGWEAMDAADLIESATIDVSVTSTIFAANRAGIEVGVDSASTVLLNKVVRLDEYPQLDSVCNALPTTAGSSDSGQTPASQADSFTPGIGSPVGPFLEVVYVAKMPGRGYSCPDAPIVLLDWHGYQATTAAHELGHITELRNKADGDDVGHTNGRPGFDQYNLMWEGSDVEYASERFGLTVGQVYRMNRHEDTWVGKVKPRSPVDCGTDGTGNDGNGKSRCPPLSKDID